MCIPLSQKERESSQSSPQGLFRLEHTCVHPGKKKDNFLTSEKGVEWHETSSNARKCRTRRNFESQNELFVNIWKLRELSRPWGLKSAWTTEKCAHQNTKDQKLFCSENFLSTFRMAESSRNSGLFLFGKRCNFRGVGVRFTSLQWYLLNIAEMWEWNRVKIGPLQGQVVQGHWGCVHSTINMAAQIRENLPSGREHLTPANGEDTELESVTYATSWHSYSLLSEPVQLILAKIGFDIWNETGKAPFVLQP